LTLTLNERNFINIIYAKEGKMMKPKLFTALKDYSKARFFKDVSAGVIVGVVALPLAIAFAIASKVSPEKGLITAIVAGFLISALGGSRVQIGGPTGAFVVIVAGIVGQYGLNGLIIATFMAGAFLVIMGFAKLGNVIKFIPYPVIVGFTTGIAVIIFSSQLNNFLGLKPLVTAKAFPQNVIYFINSLSNTSIYALLIGIATIVITMFWPKIYPKIPGSLIALILSVLAVSLFKLPVETIGSRFGSVGLKFTFLNFSKIDFNTVTALLNPAFAIALLAGIESLLSAIVADGMINSKHDSNTELVAQGIANMASAALGGIPATGAIARTATNIKNGGRTPIAGIVHAITLFIIVVLLGGLSAKIPLACLAGILVVVAYNMSEWRIFIGMRKNPKSDFVVLLTTFIITVVIDLVIAIEIGLILAVFLFIRRMSEVSNVSVITGQISESEEEEIANEQFYITSNEIPSGVEVYEIKGAFFFGAADKFKEAMKEAGRPPKVRIIRMRHVSAIDATGLSLLNELFESSKRWGIKFILSGINQQPLKAIEKSGLLEKVKKENICLSFDNALERAKEIMKI
jgi:SulP family sulfate permease